MSKTNNLHIYKYIQGDTKAWPDFLCRPTCLWVGFHQFVEEKHNSNTKQKPLLQEMNNHKYYNEDFLRCCAWHNMRTDVKWLIMIINLSGLYRNCAKSPSYWKLQSSSTWFCHNLIYLFAIPTVNTVFKLTKRVFYYLC